MKDKSLLKNALLMLERDALTNSAHAYTAYLAESHRDPMEPEDRDKTSRLFENSELASAFDAPVHDYEDAVDHVNRIDFSPKSRVEEGALVCIKGHWFVIAVATARFKLGKMKLMGISAKAPIYEAMQGKTAGDRFTFRGEEIEIEAVA